MESRILNRLPWRKARLERPSLKIYFEKLLEKSAQKDDLSSRS
jgi:hypothetical protein